MAYVVAKTGELPRNLERSFKGDPIEGSVFCAVLALAIVNWTLLKTSA
jgi:hypothetical protein